MAWQSGHDITVSNTQDKSRQGAKSYFSSQISYLFR